MQGKKHYSEKLYNSFQLSERVPKENFYHRLKDKLDLKFLYSRTAPLYGDTGNPSIDPVVFFKLLLVGYMENITSDRKQMEHCSMRMDIVVKTKRELKKNNFAVENILSDTGYISGVNYHELEKQHITPYIPTIGVYKHDRDGFAYNKEEDSFTCRYNKKLLHKKPYTNAAGSLMKSYRSTRKDCRGCPFRNECLGKKRRRKNLS